VKEEAEIPQWAPRVPQDKIRRLYETDARGIYDSDLLDEVGYALLSRCQSFIEANEAREGRVRCPRCAATVSHAAHPDTVLHCACGWTLPWPVYFGSIQHVQLSGAEPVLEQFRAFVRAFPAARTPRQKMLTIDRLIHGFHTYLKTDRPTRPVAINLIEGRLNQVVAFLDGLAYSDRSTPGVAEQYRAWDRGIDANADWYGARRRQRPDRDAS
jgi:ribosomal protein S27AE